jgi:hypothetical protein
MSFASNVGAFAKHQDAAGGTSSVQYTGQQAMP